MKLRYGVETAHTIDIVEKTYDTEEEESSNIICMMFGNKAETETTKTFQCLSRRNGKY